MASGKQSISLSDQVTICPLCESTTRRLFYRGQHHGISIQYWQCQGCGLVYQSPRMSETELDEFYAEQYRVMYQGQAAPVPGDLRTQERRAQHLASLLPSSLSPGYHLDIGSAAGELVKAIHQRYGCRAEGIEPSNAYRQTVSAQGGTVYASLDEWRAAGQDAPDLITLSHVMEHFTDPVDYLITLRRDILKRGGHLLIEVPNLYTHLSFEIAHNFAFSPAVIQEVLRKAGYKVLWTKQHGVPKRRSPIYLTLFAQALDDPLPPYTVKSSGRWDKTARRFGRGLVWTEENLTQLSRKIRARLKR